jgi:hypothetical protein
MKQQNSRAKSGKGPGRADWQPGHGQDGTPLRLALLDFDELTYLDLNPDVLRAVLNGQFQSGYDIGSSAARPRAA